MKEFRRNNPMNLRYSERNNWVGQTGQSNGFCEFKSVEYGFRAAFLTLRNYGRRGCNTIRSIVNRWAPPSENPTQTYIKFVATGMKHLGYGEDGINMADIRLDMKNDLVLVDLMMFMAKFETGVDVQAKEIVSALKKLGMLQWKDEPIGVVSISN